MADALDATTRSNNFMEILQELDPLPELPEAGEDRFFSKEALDFQYATLVPVETTPPFPTWGSTGAEMAAIGAATAAATVTANANANLIANANTVKPLPSSSATSTTTVAAPSPPVFLAPAATTATATPMSGTKRPLPTEPQQQQQQQQQSSMMMISSQAQSRGAGGIGAPPVLGATAAAADRTVFLRQRLGFESVSSGDSSTSTSSSDNGSGSGSDGVAGEWEGCSKGNGAPSAKIGSRADGGGAGARAREGQKGDSRRSVKPFTAQGSPAGFPHAGGGGGSGVVTAAAMATAPKTAGSAVSSPLPSPSLSKATGKAAARRKKYGGPSTSAKKRSRKSGARRRDASSDGGSLATGGSGARSVGVGAGSRGIVYASWDQLVRPFKQQWDHEAPRGGLTVAGASKPSVMFMSNSGSYCSIFSPEPRPLDASVFTVEQCSAQAHPMAVASYVLRVRCAGGAHIVRRTWDDIVSLCIMLGRDTSLSPPTNTNTPAVNGATILPHEDSIDKKTRAAAAAAVARASGSAGVEFTPADVVARDAASRFLTDLLARPGMARATLVRRFLELEYLDGSMRGGLSDGGREKTARQVVTMAAASAAAAAAAANAVFGTPRAAANACKEKEVATAKQQAGALHRGSEVGRQEASVSAPPGAGFAASASSVARSSSSFAHSHIALRLPPHPDAARDLAAVCRCLGELGASAFTSLPLGGAAPMYWADKQGSGRVGKGGEVGLPQRGLVLSA